MEVVPGTKFSENPFSSFWPNLPRPNLPPKGYLAKCHPRGVHSHVPVFSYHTSVDRDLPYVVSVKIIRLKEVITATVDFFQAAKKSLSFKNTATFLVLLLYEITRGSNMDSHVDRSVLKT